MIFASYLAVKFSRVESYISISDTFIFLSIFLFQAELAILLSFVRGLYIALVVTRKPVPVALITSVRICSVFLIVHILKLYPGLDIELLQSNPVISAGLAITTVAVVHYAICLTAFTPACLRDFTAVEPAGSLIPTRACSIISALCAGATAASVGVVGFYSLLAFIPIAGVIALVSLSYFSNQKNLKALASQMKLVDQYMIELRASQTQFQSAFSEAPIGMALVTPDGRWLEVNPALCKLLGYSESEMLSLDVQKVVHPDELYRFLCKINQVITGEVSSHQIETRYRHKLGHEVWVLESVSLVREPQSNCVHLIFQIQDITHRKRGEEKLIYDASHDALTGLPNRAWFMSQLDLAVKESSKVRNRPFAVLFLDLDRFKVINDSLGHPTGDELLKGIAERLRRCLGPADKISRLGGDEFTILLTGIRSKADVISFVERIQVEIARPFTLRGYETYTTASIGIAISTLNYHRPEDILRDADIAMYKAKSLGKARHVIFDETMHISIMSRLQLETDLHRAIERGELFLEYQPIVSLQTGEPEGFEALIRWQHPDRGLISPDEFISLAEEAGFIIPIGRWIIGEACRQMRQWQDELSLEHTFFVSVNISSKQFSDLNLLDYITEVLNMTGLDSRMLKLEITESTLMENFEAAMTTLKRLRSLGVGLSIDDFGTGYSSLSHLHSLPISTLKIDQSFISRIGENNENREIVNTIIVLAQNLGMKVIAEGIETKQQLELLRGLNCSQGQGFLFSRSVDAKLAGRVIQETVKRKSTGELLQGVFREGSFAPLASEYSM
jgi:diguanylate cyclase (GGDEF)-like protein/PAS domain S-box-containing protein